MLKKDSFSIIFVNRLLEFIMDGFSHIINKSHLFFYFPHPISMNKAQSCITFTRIKKLFSVQVDMQFKAKYKNKLLGIPGGPKLCTFSAKAQVQSLVMELRSCKACGMATKKGKTITS